MNITAKAYAKINLTLEVLGKRPDGYHEIASVLQTVSLADDLTFEPADTLTLECDDPALSDDDNLVLRAARILQERGRTTKGARITLRKGIAAAAGLGGGSVDAAVTLLALNQLWGLKLGGGFLRGMAATLGSDIPYLLHGGTALAKGRGEDVTPLPFYPASFLIITPNIQIPNKTAALYSRIQPEHYTTGRVTQRLVEDIWAGRKLKEPHQWNAFDRPAFALLPALHDLRLALLQVAWSRPHVCGAGPSLFAPIPSVAHGERMIHDLGLQDLGRCFAVDATPKSADFTFED